jgi:hypothetical protein
MLAGGFLFSVSACQPFPEGEFVISMQLFAPGSSGVMLARAAKN